MSTEETPLIDFQDGVVLNKYNKMTCKPQGAQTAGIWSNLQNKPFLGEIWPKFHPRCTVNKLPKDLEQTLVCKLASSAVLLTFYHNISTVCVVPVQLSVLIDSTLETGFRHLNDVSIFFLSYLHTDKFTKITKSIFLTWQGITVGCAFSAWNMEVFQCLFFLLFEGGF